MKTGYFAKYGSYPKGTGYDYISIARYNKFWKGGEYKKLAPPPELLSISDKEAYEQAYREHVLAKLDPKTVYDELGENAVLLCYEKFEDCLSGKTFCHRHIVAAWLKETLHIEVKELEYENKQSAVQLHF